MTDFEQIYRDYFRDVFLYVRRLSGGDERLAEDITSEAFFRALRRVATGALTLSFSDEVTNYKLQQVKDPDERQTVYHLEVWTSVWDKMFHRPGAQAVTAAPENGKPPLIYFTQFINGRAESSSDK